MTREVAEKIVRGITDKIECNTADIDDWAEFWGFTREDYEEFLDMAIKALKQTDKIEESHFSSEQYKADLQGAYDCGYNCGYAEAMNDIAEREVKE